MAGWRVEVTGFRQLMDALKLLDEKAYKVIVKEITSASKDVATAASYFAPGRNPVSNWGPWTATKGGRDLSFDPAAVAGGFKVRRKNFRKRGVSRGLAFEVYQSNAAGAIYEVIGSGARVTTPPGAHLVAMMNSRFPGHLPRSTLPAYYTKMTPEFRDSLVAQIHAEARRVGLY